MKNIFRFTTLSLLSFILLLPTAMAVGENSDSDTSGGKVCQNPGVNTDGDGSGTPVEVETPAPANGPKNGKRQ